MSTGTGHGRAAPLCPPMACLKKKRREEKEKEKGETEGCTRLVGPADSVPIISQWAGLFVLG